MSVHRISRGKQKICKERTAALVSMILDDESYLKKNWDKRIELVTEVGQQLNDPQFVLERLASLLQPIIEEHMSIGYDVRKAESALQELRSFLKQPNNTVPNQDGANEIHNSNSIPNQFTQIEDIHNLHEFMLRTKQESSSINEEYNQIMAFLEQKGQRMKNMDVYLCIAKMLEKVVYSCAKMANEGLNQDIGHGDGSGTIDRKEGHLRLIFLPTPVPDQEVISQEEQPKEVTLTIRSVAGRLAQLKLANPEKIDHLRDFFVGIPDDFPENIDISDNVSEDILDNVPVNSPDNTCIIHGYKVSNCNADALQEIFDKHPNFDENFGISHPDLQNYFMNLLAGLYKKIKSGEEDSEDKLKLEDVTKMESMVRDMELNGLQLSWLQEMLTVIGERKTLEERIASRRANALKAEREALKAKEEAQKAKQEAHEAEQQLAELKKKRRFD